MIAGALLENAQKAKAAGRKAALRTIICGGSPRPSISLLADPLHPTGRNRLENGSSQAFADAFAALGSLVEVRMPQNGIRMEGIEAIVKGLRSNPDLEVLDLQDNTATEKGSRAIAASLPSCVLSLSLAHSSSADSRLHYRWPKLRKLNLSDCLLRPRGGVSVMTTLSRGSNPALTSLLLQSNELDFRAVDLLATAITQHLPDLVELELNGNRGEAEDECYVKIASALEKWDHADALDELDELEEYEEDDEDDEEDEEEDEVVAEDEKAEEAEPKTKDEGEGDELAAALGKVHIA